MGKQMMRDESCIFVVWSKNPTEYPTLLWWKSNLFSSTTARLVILILKLYSAFPPTDMSSLQILFQTFSSVMSIEKWNKMPRPAGFLKMAILYLSLMDLHSICIDHIQGRHCLDWVWISGQGLEGVCAAGWLLPQTMYPLNLFNST